MRLVTLSAALLGTAAVVLMLTSSAGGTATGSWPEFRSDAAHSGLNASESSIAVGDVPYLTTEWTANLDNPVKSSPAVVGGVVYVGSTDGKLYAFDAAGSTGCSGTPKICNPLWTASTGSYIVSS